ncbi:FAD-dependent oxidoreductase [Rhodococcus aetherivorans]|uniref:FAD-dependent oxidoreductase n=1 Tax=Rhodococcus aetherivorans TaxID=191292 RepID=UPI0002D24824|nr:FAD-dependent oxidoreductase [Rhodococcus aetherivorans]CCW11475.1 2-polyprenyl-6-methoxyphenol hydroxylase and related FAD-dependent oxidoreductases [Rhodococcus aetherivorans]
MSETSVLVVGAGPVGLTAALELRRRGVDVVIVDRLPEPPQYAKAVGIQPRTLEVWDAMGVLRPSLDVSAPMHGQLVYVDGQEVMRLELALLEDVPYRFVCMPQYATERVLTQALAEHGTVVRRGVELTGFDRTADGVVAALRDGEDTTRLAARYLVGCDGAHSAVRKGLGVSFDGDAFPEEYMLADVELDWSMPAGYGIRASTRTDGTTTDMMVCIPLPGDGRYRLSTFVAPDLATSAPGVGTVAHGLEGGRRPTLGHIQAVLDRLAPEPTRASALRWSSVFRISHRLAGNYGGGRVFLAGDAAHIHPPTGAQGMNTGIQDAYNLGWKLALAVQGRAADGLLDSYDAERRPIGEEVVRRTVRHARQGIGAGETDAATAIAREAQLLLGYPGSPLVGGDVPDGGGPAPGDRAPDATGLRQDAVASPLRLHELLRHPGHTVLLWAPTVQALASQRELAERAADRFGDALRAYVLVAEPAGTPADGRVLRDDAGRAAQAYGFGGAAAAVVVRPDGYVGFRAQDPTIEALTAHLGRILRPGR